MDQHVAGVPIDMSPVSRGKGLGSVSSGQQGHTGQARPRRAVWLWSVSRHV